MQRDPLTSYSRLAKLVRDSATFTASQLVKFLPNSGVVADIGAGSGVLSYHLAMQLPKARVLATDDYVETVYQPDPHFRKDYDIRSGRLGYDDFPLLKLEATAIVLVDVLHHIDTANIKRSIEQCRDSLVTGGHVVIIENCLTSSQENQSPPSVVSFGELSDDEQILAYEFVEFFSHLILMNSPFSTELNIKTISVWKQLWECSGFKVVAVEPFPKIPHKLHNLPKAILVLQRD